MLKSWWETDFLIISIAFISVSSFANASEEPKSYEGYSLFRTLPQKEVQLEALHSLMDEKYEGIEFWTEPGLLNNTVDILVSPEKHDYIVEKLKLYRVQTRKIMYDVGEVIRRANRPAYPYITFRQSGSSNSSLLNFYNLYQRLSKIESRLQEMAESNSMMSLELAGYSYEGRKIHLVKISSDPAAKKPIIFLDAGHHAREWISHSTILYIMDGLLTGKVQLVEPSNRKKRMQTDQLEKLNQRLKALLDKYDFWFVPVVNPDGYEYTHNSDRLWRKTRSRPILSICTGTDPNRNYPFHWREKGASAMPCDETYAGIKPMSEPEVAAITSIMDKNKDRISMYLTLHSYGQLILTPYGYDALYPKNYSSMKKVAVAGAEAIASVYGKMYKYGPSAIILYPAAGGSDDYAYGIAKIPHTYVIELPDKGNFGFLLPANHIIPVGKETLIGIIAMIEAI